MSGVKVDPNGSRVHPENLRPLGVKHDRPAKTSEDQTRPGMDDGMDGSGGAEGVEGPPPDEFQFKSAAYFASFMVHRRLGDDNMWVRCQGWDAGHEIDSRAHYYDREVGFQRGHDDQDMIDNNPRTAEAYARRRLDPVKRKAHACTVIRWSMFERFVLSEMPNVPYAAFLRQCDVGTPNLKVCGYGHAQCNMDMHVHSCDSHVTLRLPLPS